MTVLLIFLGLVVVSLLAWVVFIRPRQRQAAPSLELQRIEQAKQTAIADIRRRRQYADEQLRRLSRWL